MISKLKYYWLRYVWWERPRWMRYRWWFFRVYDMGHRDRWIRAQVRWPILSWLNPR